MDKYYIDMSDSNAYDIIEFKNKNSDNTVDDTCNINENIEGFTNMGQGYLNKCCPTGSVLNNNNECTKICNHCPDLTYNHYTYDVIEDTDDSVIMYTDCKKDASPYYNFNRLNNLKNQYNLLNQYDLSQNPTNASLIKDSLSTWTDAFMNLINPDVNLLGIITPPQSQTSSQIQTDAQIQTMNNTNNLLYLLALLEINPKLKTNPNIIGLLKSLKPS